MDDRYIFFKLLICIFSPFIRRCFYVLRFVGRLGSAGCVFKFPRQFIIRQYCRNPLSVRSNFLQQLYLTFPSILLACFSSMIINLHSYATLLLYRNSNIDYYRFQMLPSNTLFVLIFTRINFHAAKEKFFRVC